MKRFATIVCCVLALGACTVDREFDYAPRPNENGFALIYYWDFNNTETQESLLTPHQPFTNAQITFEGSDFDAVSDGSDLNLQKGSMSGAALRLRNPSEFLDIKFSTAGYSDVYVTYALMRTNNGAKRQRYAVSVDGGSNFSEAAVSDLITEVLTEWHLVSIDLSALLASNNNPEVVLRILMEEGNTADSGNHRMDNLSIEAKPLD